MFYFSSYYRQVLFIPIRKIILLEFPLSIYMLRYLLQARCITIPPKVRNIMLRPICFSCAPISALWITFLSTPRVVFSSICKWQLTGHTGQMVTIWGICPCPRADIKVLTILLCLMNKIKYQKNKYYLPQHFVATNH